MVENKELMDAGDKLCDEILDRLHNELPEDLKNAIEFDYEKNDRSVNGFPSITRCIGNDDFFVTGLKKAYGMKQLAGYDELNKKTFDYSEIKEHPVTLYRGRIYKEIL